MFLSEMRSDSMLARYRKDPRVILLVKNANALRSGRASGRQRAGARCRRCRRFNLIELFVGAVTTI